MADSTLRIPMRLLIQIDEREPQEVMTGGYETTVRTDAQGRVSVDIGPDAIRDAVREMLTAAMEKVS